MSEANGGEKREKAPKVRRKPELDSVLQPTFAAARSNTSGSLWDRNQQGSGLLQRQCACGTHTIGGEECPACRQERESNFLRRTGRAEAPPAKDEQPEAIQTKSLWPTTAAEPDMTEAGQNRLNASPDGSRLTGEGDAVVQRRLRADFSQTPVQTDGATVQLNQEEGAQVLDSGPAHLRQTMRPGPTSDEKQPLPKIGNLAGTKLIQRDDTAFEGGTGVGAGIAAGTMTADAIMGTTVTADNCRGLFGCNVGFKFAKAYKGTYPYRAAGKDVRGIYVKIESIYDHNICGKCDQVRLIQVLRYFKKGSRGNIITDEPTTPKRRERAGWNDPNAPSRGWQVDRLDSDTDPFYDVRTTFDSQTGSPSQPAILWDSPGHWTDIRNHGKEFQTFIVCESAGSNKKTIAGVTWGYYIDGSGTISFSPATPTATCGPTQELQDSVARWEGIAGNQRANIDFGAESPVDHEGERSILWFDLDSTNLRNDSSIDSNVHYAIANQRIRQHILATMPYTQIIIHGYSSVDGNPSYNMALSERRAIAIRDRLIGEGIPAHMLVINPHGPNSDLSPADLNRRVEIETTRFLGPVLPEHLQPAPGP